MESPSNGDLPADITLEILLRLPVKSLLKFKCVCKQWYTLIGSRSFVDQHFGHESNLERLFIQYGKPKALDQRTFGLYVDETFSRDEEPDHLKVLEKAAVILGPLNGVFCVISKSKNIALLNPAMRQFRPLRLLRLVVQPLRLSCNYTLLGFGMDPLSGDYKLVRVHYFWNNERNVQHYPPLVYVYNSGSDSWKHIEDVNLVDPICPVYDSLFSEFLNGVYYWIIKSNDGGATILAFDMSSEKFHRIQVPDGIIRHVPQILEKSLCGDSIALLSYDFLGDKCIDVWVMKKEGCWTKCSTVGPFVDRVWPLGFWKNNELLLEGETSILALNISSQKLRTVKTPVGRSIGGFWVYSYKESLVSVRREGDNCKLCDTNDFVNDFFK